MTRKRNVCVGIALITLIGALGVGQAAIEKTAAAQSGVQAPMFEVDPLWPKPLPNHWVLGIDHRRVGRFAQDHVWIVHRSLGNACSNMRKGPGRWTRLPASAAPGPRPSSSSIQEGNLVGHWGGPGDRGTNGRCRTTGSPSTHMDNVWIGGNGEA